MSEITFRTVLRGYDPNDVNHHVSELQKAIAGAQQEHARQSVELDKLQRAYSDAAARVQQLQAQVAELEESASAGVAPTFEHLGQRVGQILSLAEAEADELRAAAHADAEAATTAARDQRDRTISSAQAEATDATSRAEADAARKLADAQRRAEEILDVADREAAARREEAEAVYEDQRSKAAAAATDFERTLAQRRDQAAAEFERALTSHQRQLADAQNRLDQVNREADEVRDTAAREAEQTIAVATAEANETVRTAQDTAAKVRRESERELSATAQQRESINAQLANVRQMLSTIGGGASTDLAEAIFADVAPVGHHDAGEDAASAADDSEPTEDLQDSDAVQDEDSSAGHQPEWPTEDTEEGSPAEDDAVDTSGDRDSVAADRS